jgi:hypothetical protein
MSTLTTDTDTDTDTDTVEIDPISFAVIRNKLSAITEEQAITLKAVSGSPVVTDATDFNVGTYLADGSIVTMGPQVLFHSGSMASVVRNLIADCVDDPGINEGDMYILNDPYKGALHQQDVAIVAPVFYNGQRVAFVGSCAHQIDIGGMNFGSWSFRARGIQEEAMLLPGIKLVEGGKLRKDLWSMIMGMTRMPMTVGLDLKAMIAANNVASRRLIELFDRYGIDTVLSVDAPHAGSAFPLERGAAEGGNREGARGDCRERELAVAGVRSVDLGDVGGDECRRPSTYQTRVDFPHDGAARCWRHQGIHDGHGPQWQGPRWAAVRQLPHGLHGRRRRRLQRP